MPSEYCLNNVDIEDFLLNYWQKKPVVIRQGIHSLADLLTPNELAGLSCEEEAESRIIIENKASDVNHTDSRQRFDLLHGPFNEDTFETLADCNWTLLVQAVDHWLPEVADLLNHFRFIPRWRIDDVMVSYAPEGGSVGAHYDNYDVFLIQGAGKRRWKVGPTYSSNSPLQDNDQLRLIADFTTNEEYLLEAGDILYLPPLYGHHGISESHDCMTYSIGFRAPSHADLLSDFCDHQIENLAEELRYSDPNLSQPLNHAEISDDTIKQVQAILLEQIANTENISQWFGKYVTQSKYPRSEDSHTQAIDDYLTPDHIIYRDPASRFSFLHNDTATTLFVNGHGYECDLPFAQYITDYVESTGLELKPFAAQANHKHILETLFAQGALYFASTMDD